MLVQGQFLKLFKISVFFPTESTFKLIVACVVLLQSDNHVNVGFLCFEKGERKIRVADKRAKRLTLGSHVASPSSMSFRVSASSSVKPEKDIRIGLLGASGYTGAEVCAMLNLSVSSLIFLELFVLVISLVLQ